MSVKYLVKAPAFVNGSRVRPRADGEPVFVTAGAGLHSAALLQVDPPLGEGADASGNVGAQEDAQAQIIQLEAGLKVASDEFAFIDAYLRDVFPELPDFYGSASEGVRLTIEHLQAKAGPVQVEDKGSEQPSTVPLVEIPADWESQHHRSIIALAQRILPGEQRDLTKDQAVEAIKAEIEKRSKPAE